MWPLIRNICLSGTGYEVLGYVAFDTTEHLLVYTPGSYAFLESIFYIGCWVHGKVTLGYNICLSTPDQGRIILRVGVHSYFYFYLQGRVLNIRQCRYLCMLSMSIAKKICSSKTGDRSYPYPYLYQSLFWDKGSLHEICSKYHKLIPAP